MSTTTPATNVAPPVSTSSSDPPTTAITPAKRAYDECRSEMGATSNQGDVGFRKSDIGAPPPLPYYIEYYIPTLVKLPGCRHYSHIRSFPKYTISIHLCVLEVYGNLSLGYPDVYKQFEL
ncbi:hypothetical protein R3P38DRAFT_3191196 [Favolaschia claudopus]|uniref:Uncharacterized protein n=1 Tax=Favolaschia claudopus TaxID=2862362 RepID=A0AAW0BLA7_9AGAR